MILINVSAEKIHMNGEKAGGKNAKLSFRITHYNVSRKYLILYMIINDVFPFFSWLFCKSF